MKTIILGILDLIEPPSMLIARVIDGADLGEIVGVIIFVLTMIVLGII